MAAKSPIAPSPAPLRIARTYAAPRETVFRAWTDPRALTRWFAPADDFRTEVPELDLRVGGRYRVHMTQGDATHRVTGTYLEIRPPERLVFTWRWEDEPAHLDETRVTIELFERDGATELILTHDRFTDGASREEHGKGWNGCLDRLGRYEETAALARAKETR